MASCGRAVPFLTSRRFLSRTLPPRLISRLVKGICGDNLQEPEDSLEILTYPHPKLRAINQEITVFDDNLRLTAENMLRLMYSTDGVGLAAPQVGINKRLMVFNQSGNRRNKKHEIVLVNPKVSVLTEEMEEDEEACLSFPDITGYVKRHTKILVSFQDLRGTSDAREFDGYEARIFQHEFDHLNGVLFVDHFGLRDKRRVARQLLQMIEDYGEGGLA